MAIIDIFIKTYHKDFSLLKYCLMSIKKYVSHFRRVVIISDNDGNKIPNDILSIMNIHVVYENIPSEMKYLGNQAGYLAQQVIKLNWFTYTDADSVLIIDSDCMFTCPTSPKNFMDEHGRYKWFYRDWNDAPDAKNAWFATTYNVLGFEPPYEAMCVNGFMLEKKTSINLLNYFNNKYNVNNLWQYFNKNQIKTFSEFNTYGNFLYNYGDNKIYNKVLIHQGIEKETGKPIFNSSIFQGWSWKEVSQEEITKRNTILYDISKKLQPAISETYVSSIHHKYYSETKNINNYGVNYKIPIDNDTMERVYVDPYLFVVHKNDQVVSDCLKTGVLYEKFIISFVKNFIDPTKNILDIGANIGTHTIPYSTHTIGNVYAFEPQPVIFELLQKNIESNYCNTIYPYNFGASDKDDIFFMNARYDQKKDQGAFKICEEKEGDIGIHVECKRIDNLNIPNVGYIKIDVEDHELNTLLGLEKTIRTNLPNLMIEIHDSSSTRSDILELIENLGYKFYYKLSHSEYIFSFNYVEV